MKVIGREAGEKWKSMSAEDKEPYELLSTASKAEYARMKQLSPAERIMVMPTQAMHHPERCMFAMRPALLAWGQEGRERGGGGGGVRQVIHHPGRCVSALRLVQLGQLKNNFSA